MSIQCIYFHCKDRTVSHLYNSNTYRWRDILAGHLSLLVSPNGYLMTDKLPYGCPVEQPATLHTAVKGTWSWQYRKYRSLKYGEVNNARWYEAFKCNQTKSFPLVLIMYMALLGSVNDTLKLEQNVYHFGDNVVKFIIHEYQILYLMNILKMAISQHWFR